MLQSLDRIDFIIGNLETLKEAQNAPAMRVFDERVTSFLSALSSKLFANRDARGYPDVMTFGFWCRRANIMSLSQLYVNEHRLGRGVAFHIAPSNIPMNFAYSLVVGMLSGNTNVVRIPSKDFPQIEIVCKAIDKLLPEFPEIARRLFLVRYGRCKEVTDYLSMICDSRVIWGGDATVEEIRNSPLHPGANEITFPERYSICLISSDRYLRDFDRKKTARDFFNDTYFTDQNACTSPRIVIWFGDKIKEAKEMFWTELYEHLGSYNLQPIKSVDKLTSFYKFATDNHCELIENKDNKIIRVKIYEIAPQLVSHFDNSGYFYEFEASSLKEVLPILGRKCQTLSYIGFEKEELLEFVLSSAPFGVDRIVPVGKTMDFTLVWDGIDLIRILSRKISI